MIQFKILHRLLNVKEYLKKCNIEPTDKCLFCDETESIEHAFFDCSYNQNFLNKCKQWIDKRLEVSFPMTREDLLFSIKNEIFNRSR